MAYYNGFPTTYQPIYPQYQQPVQPPVQQPQQNQGIIWVQGEAGAKSYLVAPNSTVQLWDSESKTIFLKSADASGMPSMKILDYTIRGESVEKPAPAPEYATREEVNALAEKIKDLEAGRRRASKLLKEDDDE
jgi:hypothetical protein